MIVPVEVQDLYASVQYVRRQLGSWLVCITMQAYIGWIVSCVVLTTTVKEVKLHPCRVHSCWSSPKMRFLLIKSCCCKMYSPPCKGMRISAFLVFSFRIQNPGKFFLWNPESHYWLKSRKLVLPTKTCTVHGAGTHGVGSRIQQCLGFHYVGQRHHTGSPNTKNFAKRKSKKQNKLIWQTTHLMHHGS